MACDAKRLRLVITRPPLSNEQSVHQAVREQNSFRKMPSNKSILRRKGFGGVSPIELDVMHRPRFRCRPNPGDSKCLVLRLSRRPIAFGIKLVYQIRLIGRLARCVRLAS